MKRIFIPILALLFGLSLSAAGQPESSTILATTSWTAAFAHLAGVDAALLAPYEMQHPSEYELKPSDMALVGNAEMIVFAGYENMVGKIQENAGSDTTQMVQITTVMNQATMEESVMKIAAAAGTEEEARKNLDEMSKLLESSRAELDKAGYKGQKAVVHFFQQAFAREMGFEVVAVYGPQPLQAAQIGEIAALEADIIIDNWHNAVSQPLQEVLPYAKSVEWINFPGKGETETLFDVVEYNIAQLKAES
ncbi:MAG: zinc ABC transporter substrate-binding protein [Spirochaetales bacterium]|nr:zinc ABC transporter substrate-binding protein [Spirochaetales bacterium]